jgi:hypothetical protein
MFGVITLDRKKEQAELLYTLGAYIAPIENLASGPNDFSESDWRRIMARVVGDRHTFGNMVSNFMQERPGRPYSMLQNKFLNALKRLVLGAAQDEITPQQIRLLLNECVPLMQEAILDVPLENVDRLLDRLCGLKKESIKESIRIWTATICSKLQGYDGAKAAADISRHYDVRSKLLHAGSAPECEIKSALDWLTEFIPAVLALLVSEAAHDEDFDRAGDPQKHIGIHEDEHYQRSR